MRHLAPTLSLMANNRNMSLIKNELKTDKDKVSRGGSSFKRFQSLNFNDFLDVQEVFHILKGIFMTF